MILLRPDGQRQNHCYDEHQDGHDRSTPHRHLPNAGTTSTMCGHSTTGSSRILILLAGRHDVEAASRRHWVASEYDRVGSPPRQQTETLPRRAVWPRRLSARVSAQRTFCPLPRGAVSATMRRRGPCRTVSHFAEGQGSGITSFQLFVPHKIGHGRRGEKLRGGWLRLGPLLLDVGKRSR